MYIDWVKRKKRTCTLNDMEKFSNNSTESKREKVTVSDRMQTNYSYTLTAKTARKVEDIWQHVVMPNGYEFEFRPYYMPHEMLERGVFCGRMINDCMQEFPLGWYRRAIEKKKLSPSGANCSLNFYGVKSGISLRRWRDEFGWIKGGDPRGWFQWYCRYCLGRRDTTIVSGKGGKQTVDEYQMRRWNDIRRWGTNVKNNGETPVKQQLLLQWSWPSTQKELRAHEKDAKPTRSKGSNSRSSRPATSRRTAGIKKANSRRRR